MNAEQTLAAAEVMRRAAEGEPVEVLVGIHWIKASENSAWDWAHHSYRIAEPPPHAPTAHNPDSQVQP